MRILRRTLLTLFVGSMVIPLGSCNGLSRRIVSQKGAASSQHVYVVVATSNQALKHLSKKAVREATKPRGPLGQVVDKATIDLAASETLLPIYSGHISSKTFEYQQFVKSVNSRIVDEAESPHALLAALNRVNNSLDQFSSQLHVVVVTEGILASSREAEISGLAKSIATGISPQSKRKGKLISLCIAGVLPQHRSVVTNALHPLREVLQVVSDFNELDGKRCFPNT